MPEESKVDSISVVGSVDSSEKTREDLLKELSAPSCVTKPPKVTISSRKGDVPDSVKKTIYIGGEQSKDTKQKPVPEPTQEPQEEPPDIPAPNDVSSYDIPSSKDFEAPTQPQQKESKIETKPKPDAIEPSEPKTESSVEPDFQNKHQIILSATDTDASLERKNKIFKKQSNFKVDVESDVNLGFNPYSDICSTLGFLIQGLHEDLRSLESGSYNFKLHIEKVDYAETKEDIQERHKPEAD